MQGCPYNYSQSGYFQLKTIQFYFPRKLNSVVCLENQSIKGKINVQVDVFVPEKTVGCFSWAPTGIFSGDACEL